MYTTPYCPFCLAAKALLQEKGVRFDEIDVSGNPDLRATMMAESGGYTVPQVFIDATPIGGYDELSALERRGELDRLLSAEDRAAEAMAD
jgi:glutaredoxin 3